MNADATLEKVTLHHDGRDRHVLVAVPPGDDGPRPYPVVVGFHGHNGTKERYAADTALVQRATSRGYLVVLPDALGAPSRWNWSATPGQADDFGFVSKLLEHVTTSFETDPARLYAAGYSNGAAFAALVACREPFPFAAVAMVAGTVPALGPEGVGPSVVAVHGTADAVVPYADVARTGSDRPGDVATWGERYGCASPPERDEVLPGVERLRHVGGAGGREAVLYTVAGGIHAWPGGIEANADPANSEAGRLFPATEVILDFFDQHRLPRR